MGSCHSIPGLKRSEYELGMWLAMQDTWEIAKERYIEWKGKVEIDGYYW